MKNLKNFSGNIDFKKFLTIALIITAAGLGLRLLMVWNNSPLVKGGDEFEYEALARDLANTGTFITNEHIARQAQGGEPGDPTAYRLPVLPAFLAAHYKIFGFDNTAPRITMAFLSALCCLVIAILGWNLGYARQGLIAAGLWAIWASDLFSDFVLGRLYPETIGTLFFIAAFACLAAYLSKQKLSFLIGSGIFMGLAALSRGYVVLTIPIMALFILYVSKQQRIKAAFIFCLFASFILAPWIIRNWIVMGKPVLATQTDTFWIGNNPWSRGSLDGEIWRDRLESRPLKYLEAIHPNIAKMGEIERSDMYVKESFNYIKSNPTHFLWLLPRKTAIFFGPFQTWSIGFYKYHYAFSIMLVFAIIGLLKLRNSEERKNILLLTIPIIGVYCVILLTYALDRYRFTIEPFVVLLGVIGIFEIISYFKSSQKISDSKISV